MGTHADIKRWNIGWFEIEGENNLENMVYVEIPIIMNHPFTFLATRFDIDFMIQYQEETKV